MPRAIEAVAVLLLSSLTASAFSADAARWSTQAAATLAARGDPGSLATAALLLTTFNHASTDATRRAVNLAQAASQTAPSNRTLGWIRLRVCETTPGCDVPEAAANLRWLDAENAAAWLSTLEHAQADHDAHETERALSGMAQGRRFNFYWNPAITLIDDALRSASLPAGPGESTAAYPRLIGIVGWGTTILTVNLHPVFDACKPNAEFVARRDNCLKIAQVMQHADTVIAQLAGLSLTHRGSAPDSKEGRNAQEHHRILEWRVVHSGKFETAFLPWSRNRLAQHRFDLMRRFEREEDCINTILIEHRAAMEPAPAKTH